MQSVVRSLAAAALVAISLSCADQSVGVRRGVRVASLPIAPVFLTSASGGPKIDIETIRGVLRRENSTDSAVAEAPVEGDSAVLEFEDVTVSGEETTYQLAVQAFDASGVVVFEGSMEVTVTPGANSPAAPTLTYTAPDATVAAIDVQAGGASASTVELQWAGAQPGNTSCLSRIPNSSAKTQEQLAVAGTNASSQTVPNVRVGWVSRDSSVATVDENGLVRARCSNRFTYIVARTFLDVVDSVKVNVTAPPFTLLMNPETANVPRGDQLQMTAVLVDENNNATATSAVNWNSSDPDRATVSATGLVTGISNGRVVITASSGDRSTVGIIQVRPPLASRVVLSVAADTIAVGQTTLYGVTAFDSNNDPIPDASGYAWASTNSAIVSASSSGTIRGVSAGAASIIVSLDGKKDTVSVLVTASTTGRVAGRVMDAATGAAVATATITGTGGGTAQTAADGRFESTPLAQNGSSITVSRTGYVSFTYFNLPILLGQTVELGDLPMAPTGGTGTLTGTVVNALNDQPVANATVKLFAGINPSASDPSSGVTTPGPVATTTTSANGSFAMPSVAAGTYTYSVTAPNFSFTRTVAVAITGVTRDSRITLSPTVSGNGLRIVLTWGDCTSGSVPCDLDSHLTGPTSPPDAAGRFQVAYFNPFYFNSPDTVAVLDNDATGGLGPETITLRQKAAGAYKYYVHNYSDGADTTSTRLSTTAQARVNVYQGTNLIATFLPPSGQAGTLWAVFQIEGTTLTPINQILRVQDFNELPADFMRVGAESSESDVSRVMTELRKQRPKRK
jgi:uncharacterized protein YfaP (DUF2135 family)